MKLFDLLKKMLKELTSYLGNLATYRFTNFIALNN